MTLIETIRDLDAVDIGSTIYAAEPWTEQSTAIVAPEPQSGEPPERARQLGLKYFLEVAIARTFLEGWISNLGAEPTLTERCARLIQYAVTDA